MPGGLDDYENKFFGSSSTFVGDNQNLIAVGSGVDDSPVHIYRKSDASICVLITTNDDAASLNNIGADGYINVEIDDGNDIDIIAGQLFAAGEVVLDRCFNRIDTVTITGPDTNGWKGSIMFSTDGKETYTPFVCSGCTGDSDLTSQIAVDGNGNGGGGNIRGIHVHNYYEEDDSGDSSDGVAFNLASLSWIRAQSDPHENDNDIPDGVSNDDIEHYQHHEVSPTKNLRGGGVSTKSNNSSKKSTSSSIINDSLDSIQTILFQPNRVLSKRLPTNPWKKKDDDEETKKLKQKEEELLSTTKVQSVSAPDSELLPPDYITECAKESNLIGGTLTPETLDLTAKRINRLYLENGYIMNSVTGATLVPSSNGKDDNEEGGHVELKVTEVKVAKHASPVHIRFVEKINIEDAADDDESVRSLPSQPFHQTNSDSQTTTIKEVSGRTRPSKIASIVKLKPGSHFRIIPELWSELAASGPGGINQRRRGNSPALFSTIHAVRPIPTSDGANTVDVEVIATENKPYLSVEYGVTKSLYSDKWEGELDMKHSNAFGGGEVATVNVRKGRGTSSGQKEEESGIVRSVSGGPLSWRFSIKDEIVDTSDDITRMVYFIHQRLAIQTRGEA